MCFVIGWVEMEDTYVIPGVNDIRTVLADVLKLTGLAADPSSAKVAKDAHTHTLLASGKNPRDRKLAGLSISSGKAIFLCGKFVRRKPIS